MIQLAHAVCRAKPACLFVLRWAYMRRAISILLLVLLWLPSLTAMAQGRGGESRLPACCRRNGAHHCEMPEGMASRIVAANSGKTALIGAPSHCPLYPAAQNATLRPIFAVTPQPASLPAHPSSEHVSVARITRVFAAIGGVRAVRGPPPAVLA